jgi:hypothetical protein
LRPGRDFHLIRVSNAFRRIFISSFILIRYIIRGKKASFLCFWLKKNGWQWFFRLKKMANNVFFVGKNYVWRRFSLAKDGEGVG